MTVVCYVVTRDVGKKKRTGLKVFSFLFFKKGARAGELTHIGSDEHPLRKWIICQINLGSWSDKVKFLIFALRVVLSATESYTIKGLQEREKERERERQKGDQAE